MRLAISKVQSLVSPFPAAPPRPRQAWAVSPHLSEPHLPALYNVCDDTMVEAVGKSGQQLLGPGSGIIGSMTTCKRKGGALSVGVWTPLQLRKELPAQPGPVSNLPLLSSLGEFTEPL